MKKFTICLLLVCIIVLGCLAFTGCDKQSDDNIPRNTFWKVEQPTFRDGDCYAFYYTGEYSPFEVRLYDNDIVIKRYSTSETAMYFETLTDNPYSQYHHHIVKPNSIVYINIYESYLHRATRLEFVFLEYSYDYSTLINEHIIFSIGLR